MVGMSIDRGGLTGISGAPSFPAGAISFSTQVTCPPSVRRRQVPPCSCAVRSAGLIDTVAAVGRSGLAAGGVRQDRTAGAVVAGGDGRIGDRCQSEQQHDRRQTDGKCRTADVLRGADDVGHAVFQDDELIRS